MKKLTISLLVVLSLATSAHAETCYIFKGNQLQSKSQCDVFNGGGAAASFTEVTIGNKSYEISETWNASRGESYDKNAYEYDINGKPARHYARNRSLNITSSNNASLDCYKTKDGKIDFCISY